MTTEEVINQALEKKNKEIDMIKEVNKGLKGEIQEIKETNKKYITSSIQSFENKLKSISQREDIYIYEIHKLKEEIKK